MYDTVEGGEFYEEFIQPGKERERGRGSLQASSLV